MKTSQKLVNFVKENKRVRSVEIIKYLGISDRAVYKQLDKLVKKGILRKFGRPPKVYYVLGTNTSILKNVQAKPFKVTQLDQKRELLKRVPPVLNVDLLIYKESKFLIGRRSVKKDPAYHGLWLFPGGRMRYDEAPQETAYRVLQNELPGVNATLRRLVTALSDKGGDPRAYGTTLFYILDYISGEPQPNEQLDKFKWISVEDLLTDDDLYWVDKGVFVELEQAIRLLNSNQDELLVEVDKNNKEVGTIVKRIAHSDSTRYHRAAHIMIFTSKGEVVLHQRSKNKAVFPGKWDMFGGHQVAGQTIEQCAVSKLAEELGITTNLQLRRIGLYKDNTQSEFYYLYYGVDDGPYGFDRNEVEQIGRFDCTNLLKGTYDQDFDILPHVYGYVEELRGVWQELNNN